MKTFYVRSTGEVVGPNEVGKKHGKQNKARDEFGNLFTSRRRANVARSVVKFALWFVRER